MRSYCEDCKNGSLSPCPMCCPEFADDDQDDDYGDSEIGFATDHDFDRKVLE